VEWPSFRSCFLLRVPPTPPPPPPRGRGGCLGSGPPAGSPAARTPPPAVRWRAGPRRSGRFCPLLLPSEGSDWQSSLCIRFYLIGLLFRRGRCRSTGDNGVERGRGPGATRCWPTRSLRHSTEPRCSLVRRSPSTSPTPPAEAVRPPPPPPRHDLVGSWVVKTQISFSNVRQP